MNVWLVGDVARARPELIRRAERRAARCGIAHEGRGLVDEVEGDGYPQCKGRTISYRFEQPPIAQFHALFPKLNGVGEKGEVGVRRSILRPVRSVARGYGERRVEKMGVC